MKDAHWEHGYFPHGNCDIEGCVNKVAHRAFDDYTNEAVTIASRCEDHWNKDTQKKRLKKLKKTYERNHQIRKL